MLPVGTTPKQRVKRCFFLCLSILFHPPPVSYTHLDVYKRQAESLGEHLSEKPVTLAINGVAAGEVEVDREDLYNALNADERIVVPFAPTMVDIPEEEMEE